MSRKDENNDNSTNQNEPWEQPIYDTDYEEGLSRSRKRQTGKKNSIFATLVIILIVAITVMIFATWFWIQKPANKQPANDSTTTQTTTTSTKTTTTSSSAPAAASSSSAATSSSAAPETSSSSSSAETTPSSTTPSSSAAETTGNTYTVQAGDSFYAIATKNGLTLQQLYDLNPGTSATSSLHPGDTLNIK